MGSFACHCDKEPGQSTYGQRICFTVMVERHGGRSVKQGSGLFTQEAERDEYWNGCVHFDLVSEPSQWNAMPTFRVAFSASVKSLWKPTDDLHAQRVIS